MHKIKCSYCQEFLDFCDDGYTCFNQECWIGMAARGNFNAARAVLSYPEPVALNFGDTVRITCGECGSLLALNLSGQGHKCTNNDCSIGLAVLGDFASAEEVRTITLQELNQQRSK